MDFVEETKNEREKLVGRTIYIQQGIRDYYETKGKKFLFRYNNSEQTKKCNACHLPE